jgi:hypothetical protein
MKNKLMILLVVLAVILFGTLINVVGLKVVLISTILTALIAAVILDVKIKWIKNVG